MRVNLTALLLFLCVNISSVCAQFTFELGINKNFVNSKSRVFGDFGFTIQSYYAFMERGATKFEVGLGFTFNEYSHIDWYSNTYLINDPNYSPDYNQSYFHRSRNTELTLPVLCSNTFDINGFTPFVIGVGVRPRVYLTTMSTVFLDGDPQVTGKGIRLTDFKERIKLQESVFIGFPVRKFELRLEENGLIASALGLNKHFYYYTDKEIRLSQISLKIRYQL